MPFADDIAREELLSLRSRGLLRALEPLRTPPGAEIELRPGERLINFSSNDYLGLAGDARVAEALAQGARIWGAGAGASRLVTGDFAAQHELEAALADFEKTESAVLFGSGYAANCGIISTFAGPEDLILSDALNHASLIDGCRLSRARVEVYPHCDAAAVDRLLGEVPARRRLVVTDTVFSMEGDRAPLRELSDLCRRHGALLVLDEAHATGVIGPRGAGLAAELGLSPDLRMATLSKAFGTAGAYVAASRAACDLLLNRARTLVYSTALPPALACAALASLRILAGPEGEERRARLERTRAASPPACATWALPRVATRPSSRCCSARPSARWKRPRICAPAASSPRPSALPRWPPAPAASASRSAPRTRTRTSTRHCKPC